MKLKVITVMLVMFVGLGLAPLGQANAEQEMSDEERAEIDAQREAAIAELHARADAPSKFNMDEAIDAMVDYAMGVEMTEEAREELAKYLRDIAGDQTDAAIRADFAEGFAAGFLGANGLDIAREIVGDKAAFDNMVETGAFDGKSFDEIALMLAPLGFDEEGVEKNADLIAMYRGVGEEMPAIPLSGPWGQSEWDTLGVTTTVVYLAVIATGAPASGELLPHNLRVNALYINIRVTSGCGGSWTNGYCFVQFDIDDLLGIAFDIRQNADSLMLQLPLALKLEVHWRLVCPWFCYLQVWFHIHLPNTVMAVNPVWEMAVPATSGGLATRAESSDILMVIYDRLGTIHSQKAREKTSAPASLPASLPTGHPGAGDLVTTSPLSNYFGVQGDFSSVPATPALPSTPADSHIPEIHKRQRGAFATPGDSTGVTAAFTAHEVRAWTLNIFIVRLSTVGAGTTGAVGEPPATIYYDSSSNIFTGSGLMYMNDWSVANPVSV